MFWTIAAAVLFIAAVITMFPLLRGKSAWQPLALALAFGLPAAGLWMYNHTGTPAAVGVQPAQRPAMANNGHSAQSQEMDAMVAGLRARLAESPDDLEGWMLLARTLRAMQQFEQSAQALEQANALAPENPLIMVDLAEAWIYLTPDGQMEPRSVELVERALEIDPNLQKGLWLMGIAASQQGEFAFAISYWQSLMAQLEPGSQVAQTVQAQIDQAMEAMGMHEGVPEMTAAGSSEPAGEAIAAETEAQPQPSAQPAAAPAGETADEPATGAWAGTQVKVGASDAALSALPPQSVLYVMVRPAELAVGPPLGVRRIVNPTFPLELTLTDADSMMQERLISGQEKISIQARVSLSGSPAARAGDWESGKQQVALSPDSTVELMIDQQVE